MTVTDSLMRPAHADGWTIDDLDQLPDLGLRYEIVDGSLLVSPVPAVPHPSATNRLRNLLAAQAPAHLEVGQDGGVSIPGPRTYFIPDIFVVHASAYAKEQAPFDPTDVLLVVEVLSPSNKGTDLVTKRHFYAAGGIRQYWIVDQTAGTLTVLELDGDAYTESAVVEPGTRWTSEYPFALTLDPADFR